MNKNVKNEIDNDETTEQDEMVLNYDPVEQMGVEEIFQSIFDSNSLRKSEIAHDAKIEGYEVI